MAHPRETACWIYEPENSGVDRFDSTTPLRKLIRFGTRPVPKLRFGEVLIEVEAAPINPSDEMFVRGQYGVLPNRGDVPGFEGCGRVLASNAGPYGWWLTGKRVSFGGQHGRGTWTQYAVASAFECIPIRKNLPLEAAATLIVNPMTAMGLIAKVKKNRGRAFVMNAAGSAVGGYMQALAQRKSLGCISLVRRQEAVGELKRRGHQNILVTSCTDFEKRFEDLCQQLNATVLLDAVAGDETARLMSLMPDRSTAIVYGQLSQEDGDGRVSVDPDGLVFRKQKLEGYWLTDELGGAVTPLSRAWQISRLYRKDQIHTPEFVKVSLEQMLDAFESQRNRKVLYVNPGRIGTQT